MAIFHVGRNVAIVAINVIYDHGARPRRESSLRSILSGRLADSLRGLCAGIPVVCTIAFLAGFAATLTFALALLGHAS
ncbi:MAG: hypothetical protein PPHEMADM_5361 [uncultured Paraburkholderia sp.]|nr:MAG: hypothetical protein PPHEMADE_5347 [uncultured Paraburkholderia sp.]CAH2944253.1 MAG: hypothetical protein PPHEMADM_5361 [uncultured Paraburkholderia sp.]